jgi:DivIVA domain-containing protein
MTDESFHLTPLDIRRYDFGSKAFRGYDAQKVEDFRNQVADELERLTKLNQELDAKAKGFHEQLRAFRERDKALNDALVSAQQLRSEMREQADREAQLILREARGEAERIVDASRSEIRKLEGELVQLDKSRVTYIAQLRAVIERQLAELGALHAPQPPQAPPQAPAAQAPAPAAPPAAAPAAPAAPRRASTESEATDTRGHVKTPAWLESLVKE